MTDGGLDGIAAPWQVLLGHVVNWAPRLLSALVLVLVGLLLAALARRAVGWFVRRSRLDELLEAAGISRLLHLVGFRAGVPQAAGALAWWVVVLAALVSATQVIGLPGIAEGLAAVVEYVPRLVAAAVVLVAGSLAADFARGTIARAGESAGLEAPGVVARGAWLVLMVVTATLAAQHLGLRTDLVEGLILIGAGASGLAAALGFALGGRELFANLLARHVAERTWLPGDRLSGDGWQGVLERYSTLAAWIRTDGGELLAIPCARLVASEVRMAPADAGDPTP